MRQRLAGLAVVALLAVALISMINGEGSARASGPNDQVALFNVTTGEWTIRYTDGSSSSFFYGNPGDTPLLGDWDCDGIATVGMFRPSNGFVYLRDTNTFGVADREFYYGLGGDIPLVGDWNHDGCDTLSIYRAGKVFVANQLGTVTAEFSFDFGNPGDRPFAGDFDGDGIDSVGLYRDTSGFAYFRNSLDSGIAEYSFYYGEPSDRILAGDWDGDGDDSVGIFRPADGIFYLSYENQQGAADLEVPFMSGNFMPLSGRVEENPVATTNTTTTTTTSTTTTTTTTLPAEPFTLMALGDSITEGYTTNQGGYSGNTYRYYLWHDLNAAGHSVDFVGSFTTPGNGSYADPNFDQDHQARSGANTAELLVESADAIATFHPDVAIVQIGVNDIWG
ncbi:MAG: SGNH/GDSL hydrolase family protein, partial [Acidimicrobiia bacterium]|nr:SGNH/GDSL hydrolase family protein [Acidimicrobiia bacterium]NNL27686.1 SGNH/GDSL hydrolase family protein [Acidimicrobiia bacterium]